MPSAWEGLNPSLLAEAMQPEIVQYKREKTHPAEAERVPLPETPLCGAVKVYQSAGVKSRK